MQHVIEKFSARSCGFFIMLLFFLRAAAASSTWSKQPEYRQHFGGKPRAMLPLLSCSKLSRTGVSSLCVSSICCAAPPWLEDPDRCLRCPRLADGYLAWVSSHSSSRYTQDRSRCSRCFPAESYGQRSCQIPVRFLSDFLSDSSQISCQIPW